MYSGKKIFNFPKLSFNRFPLLSYSLIIFFLSLADAIMSYSSPVIIESHYSNEFFTGLILSMSSIAGIICDFLFVNLLKKRSIYNVFWLTIFFAALFPLVLLLFPSHFITFIFAMVAWGIYYELIQFSNFSIVEKFGTPSQYLQGWGILNSFRSLAYFVGPLIATFLLKSYFSIPLISAILLLLVTAFFFLIFTKTFPLGSKHISNSEPLPRIPFSNTFHNWLILSKKLWPLIIFLFVLGLIDSAFWSVGVLWTEQLSGQPWGWALLPAYVLPGLFMGLLSQKLTLPSGKKRTSFVFAGLAGITLGLTNFISTVPILIIIIFISSVFISISWPEISAVFEDYVHRLGNTGNEIIGINGSVVSLAYIIGPILTGFMAAFLGNQTTLAFTGVLLVLVSIICLFVVPRKIHLPQSELI